jgi:hypothetical protein
LVALNCNHKKGVVDEDEIGYDDSTGTWNICEIADRRVDGVEGIAGDVESQVVEGKAFHAK